MSELIPIKAFPTRMEADLAKAILEANGIGAVLQADDAGGMRPGLGSLQRIRILVAASDVTGALGLLTDPAAPSA
jgi:hypothetical protein